MTSEEESKENETLYVKRLNEKIKIDELKNALMALFSQFGEVVMIRARSSLKMRGQAFITFKDIENAKEAKNKLDNVVFLGSPMIISYAKSKCECALVEQGKITKEEKAQKDLNRKRKRDEYYKAMKESIEAKKANSIKEEIEMKEQINEVKIDEKAHNILFVDGITKEINEKTIKDLENKVRDKQQLIGSKDAKIDNLQFERIREKAKIKELEESVSYLNRQLEESIKIQASIDAEHLNDDLKIEELEKENRRLVSEHQKITKKLEDKSNALREANGTKGGYQKKINFLEKENQELKEKVKNLSEELKKEIEKNRVQPTVKEYDNRSVYRKNAKRKIVEG